MLFRQSHLPLHIVTGTRAIGEKIHSRLVMTNIVTIVRTASAIVTEEVRTDVCQPERLLNLAVAITVQIPARGESEICCQHLRRTDGVYYKRDKHGCYQHQSGQ